MKDTQDNETYIKIGKQWDYRLGTVSDEWHWGLKPGLRAPNLTRVYNAHAFCIHANSLDTNETTAKSRRIQIQFVWHSESSFTKQRGSDFDDFLRKRTKPA